MAEFSAVLRQLQNHRWRYVLMLFLFRCITIAAQYLIFYCEPRLPLLLLLLPEGNIGDGMT